MKMFKEIPGYPNYLVSDSGIVKTTFNRNGKKHLTPYKDEDGYLRVALYKQTGGRVYIGVHKLVAMAFLGGDHKGMCVNHINYDRCDNRLENLEWVTPSENNRHSRQHYVDAQAKKAVIGVSRSGDVVEYDSMTSAAIAIGGAASNIHRSIRTGYYHAGYKWSYNKPIN